MQHHRQKIANLAAFLLPVVVSQLFLRTMDRRVFASLPVMELFLLVLFPARHPIMALVLCGGALYYLWRRPLSGWSQIILSLSLGILAGALWFYFHLFDADVPLSNSGPYRTSGRCWQ